MKKRVWLWWSTGKDSAWSLRVLREDPGFMVERLVTTVTPVFGRVAVHGTRIEILRAQAAAVGLPLSVVEIPHPCSNEDYETAVHPVVRAAAEAGVHHMAFGDLALEDIRAYRAGLLRGSGVQPLFPIWGLDTTALAREMISAGLEARVVSLDPTRVDPALLGRRFDEGFLESLDSAVDACGEYGEFHTCVVGAPEFTGPIDVVAGAGEQRDGVWYHDLRLAP